MMKKRWLLALREPAFQEPGRADLLVGQDARQRVPTRFMAHMRDSGIVEATHAARILCALLASLCAARAQEKITYNDHVLPLVEQHCANCHNPDKKKGDLVLTSYNALLKGGGSGAVVAAGSPDSSKLWKAITHAEEPTMPPKKPKLADKDLDVFK